MSSTLEIQHNSEAFDVAVQNINANIGDMRKRLEGQVLKPAGHTILNSFFLGSRMARRYPPDPEAVYTRKNGSNC